MIAVSPRLTPYIIITAATQRPNTCTAILLFLLIQIILYMLFVFFYLRTYNSFSYNFSVFINKYCCRNACQFINELVISSFHFASSGISSIQGLQNVPQKFTTVKSACEKISLVTEVHIHLPGHNLLHSHHGSC